MGFVEIFLLSLGLAMDATAVAAARGVVANRVRVRDALFVGALFGGAQALMPAAGWLLGDVVGPAVKSVDHWIAFVLLVGIGGKMLWEARGSDDEKEDAVGADQAFALKGLLLLAVATSIDAFAVGITLPMLNAPFALSLVTIGVVTFVLSAVAVLVGKKLGALVGSKLEVVGGLVLVMLGVRILVEHLSE
jgi:putative Mn2+ efflux pump MntP